MYNTNSSKVGHNHDGRYYTEEEINAKFAWHEVAFSYDSFNSTLITKSIYQVGNFVSGSFRLDFKNGILANDKAQIATIGAHPKINYHGVAIEATSGKAIDFTISPSTGHVVINNWSTQPSLTGARVLYLAFGYPCQ